MTFLDGSTTLGTGTLNGMGAATFAVSSLSVATHPITVSYGGDSNFTGSTSPITNVVVGKADSTTTISPLAPIFYGQPATFTATVAAAAPGAGTPSQIVTFLDGTTVIGFGFLNGSSVATFSTSALSEGSHSINAFYDGDPNFLTSNSPPVTQVVNQAATSVAAPTTSQATTVYGESVTFTATVVATVPGAGMPTGPVTFKDGTTVLGAGTLNGSGVATFSTAAPSFGPHSITASYGGDANFQSSSISAATTQTVDQAATFGRRSDLLQRCVGLQRVGDVHGDGGRDRTRRGHAERDRDLPRQRHADRHRDAHRRRGDVLHRRAESRLALDHRFLRR